MLPEERQMLADLFDRVRGQANTPRDRDAESFIADAVRAQPYAPYLLAQTVLVQEQALRAADQKLQELQAQVQSLNAELDDMHAQAQRPASSGSFLGGLFGGGSAPARPAPQPQRAPSAWGAAPQQPQQGGPWGAPQPQQQPGPWGAPQPQAQGGGFLKGALGAAAGVAGGMLLADSIKGLMGGHGGFGGGMSGLGSPGAGTTVNNFYDQRPTADQASLDAQQDADQDQDDIQDAADDYGSDGGDDYSGDA